MLNWDDLYHEYYENIDYLTDRIMPYVLLKMPDKRIPHFVPERPVYAKWEDDDLNQSWEGGL